MLAESSSRTHKIEPTANCILQEAIDLLGGQSKTARICGVHQKTVRKWYLLGCLPRSEWTGETDYSEKIAAAIADRLPRAKARRYSAIKIRGDLRKPFPLPEKERHRKKLSRSKLTTESVAR